MFDTDLNTGADLVRREMTVREFLESATAVGELVVVTCGGWPTCTVHIDSEDYFRMPADIAHRKVLNSRFLDYRLYPNTSHIHPYMYG